MWQAQQLTGVAVPSYYNPAAVNPLKYAEQLKKRKMLWSKGNKETTDKEKEVQVILSELLIANFVNSVSYLYFMFIVIMEYWHQRVHERIGNPPQKVTWNL